MASLPIPLSPVTGSHGARLFLDLPLLTCHIHRSPRRGFRVASPLAPRRQGLPVACLCSTRLVAEHSSRATLFVYSSVHRHLRGFHFGLLRVMFLRTLRYMFTCRHDFILLGTYREVLGHTATLSPSEEPPNLPGEGLSRCARPPAAHTHSHFHSRTNPCYSLYRGSTQ